MVSQASLAFTQPVMGTTIPRGARHNWTLYKRLSLLIGLSCAFTLSSTQRSFVGGAPSGKHRAACRETAQQAVALRMLLLGEETKQRGHKTRAVRTFFKRFVNNLRSMGSRQRADDADGLEVGDGGDVSDAEWKNDKKGLLPKLLLEERSTEEEESYDGHKAKSDNVAKAPEEEKKDILEKEIKLGSPEEAEDEDRVTTNKNNVFRFKTDRDILEEAFKLASPEEAEDEDRVTTNKNNLFRFKPERFHVVGGERLTEMVGDRFRFVSSAA